MKKIFTLILVAGFFISASSQVLFDKTFDGGYDDSDEAMAVKETPDGGYVMAGAIWTSDDNWYDMTIMKIDATGNHEWTKTYNKGSMSIGIAYSVDVCTDGGYIIAGGTDGAGNENQVWIIKTDASGDSLWSKYYGGENQDYAHSIIQTNDGGYMIAAETNSFGAGQGDGYAIKVDENGIEEWTKTYGGASPDVFYDVKQTSDGGYVFCGAADGYMDAYIVKTNATGDTLWTKKFGGPVTEEAYSIDLTSDGGYVFAGKTMSYGAGNYDYWLVKLNSEGVEEWSNTYGGSEKDKAFGVCQLNDGGYFITGMTESYTIGEEDEDLWVVRTNASGEEIWTNNFGNTLNDGGNKCLQTTDGNLVTCGYAYVSGQQFDFYLIKMNMDGIVSINNHSAMITDLNIYPNPMTESANIRFPNPNNKTYSLTISDAKGRIVRQIQNIHTGNVNFSKDNMKPGLYFAELRGEATYSLKFMIK